MKRTVLFFLLVGLMLTSRGQLTLVAHFTDLPATVGQKMILEYMELDQWKQVEMKGLDNTGTGRFVFSLPAEGQYRFRIPGGNNTLYSDFVLTNAANEPKNIEVTLSFKNMKSNPLYIPGSPENELYFPLMTQYQRFETARTDKNTPPAELERLKRELNSIATETKRKGKNTFTAKAVCDLVYQPVREDFPSDKSLAMNDSVFYVRFGLMKMPYYESAALHHNLFVRSLERYFKAIYAENKTNWEVDFLDGVMFRSGGNEEVDAFLFKYLLDKMIGFKTEVGLSYLLTNYAQDCTENHSESAATKMLVESLKEVEPGKKIHPLSLPDKNNKNVSLLEVCKKNKITIVLFWKTTCGHCAEFKPVLKEMYEKYHPLGMEVYAVAIDKEKSEWDAFVKEHPMPWYDTYLSMESRKEFNQHYPVPSTPTLMAIDQQGRVISRLIIRGKTEELVKDYLQVK